MGVKSEVTPTESISFIGKNLDTRAGTISNAVGALVGTFRSWVRGVGRRRLPSSAMERLLGELCWLGRPNAGLGAFLAGAYSALHRGLGMFARGVAKGIATVLLFSCVPHTADPLGRCDAAPGKFSLMRPRRGVDSEWALWGGGGSTAPCAVPPGSPARNRLSCSLSMWSPSWPHIVGVRVLG